MGLSCMGFDMCENRDVDNNELHDRNAKSTKLILNEVIN